MGVEEASFGRYIEGLAATDREDPQRRRAARIAVELVEEPPIRDSHLRQPVAVEVVEEVAVSVEVLADGYRHPLVPELLGDDYRRAAVRAARKTREIDFRV